MSDEVQEEQAPPPSLMERLVGAQAAMANPPLDGVNPHFGSRFSTLASVLDAVRGPLNERGLFLNQTLDRGVMRTTVWDSSGESFTVCEVPCELPGDPQRAGSALTYLRRYSLMAAFGIVGDSDDDDAERASGSAPADGAFTARCRSCGQAYSFSGREAYEGFLASSPQARCCQSPDWRVL